MLAFLRGVGEAVVEHGVRGLASMAPGGDFACDVARRVWEKYRQRCRSQQQEMKQLAQANFEHANQVASQVADEVAPSSTPEQRQQLASFLSLVPASVRQSLKRAADPKGLSVLDAFALRSPDDMLHLLPSAPMAFRSGDAVPNKPG